MTIEHKDITGADLHIPKEHDNTKHDPNFAEEPRIATEATTDELEPDGTKKETEIYITALTDSPLEIKDPTGAASNGNTIVFKIKGSGATRNLDWGDAYEELYADLPDDVGDGETVTVMCVYFDGDWNIMSVLET